MDIGKKYNFTISISGSKIGDRREECGDTGENVAASGRERREQTRQPRENNPERGSDSMGDLGATLIKELNCETAFTIGGIGISESVVVTWIMMAVVLVVSLIVTHGLKVEHPGRGQLLLESAVTWLQGIGEGILGEEGKGYAPYLTSVLMYLGVANLLGILGFKPPTKDLNVTAALALMSIVLIETAGIRVKGLKGWLKSFTEPIAIVTPINIMEVFIKPLSLCMRLFGNVLGAFVIMKLIEYILPVGLPVLFSAYFDIFDGLIQAYVFVFLTGLFIKESIE